MIIKLADLPDREGRKGRYRDYICIECFNVWWRVIRKNYCAVCPRCESTEFIAFEGDIKVIEISPDCKNVRR